MGAVTALMHADKDHSISGLVLDSPFCSLRELTVELASNRAFVPEFMTSAVMSCVRNTIMEEANFDINLLNPLKNHVSKSMSPALFLSANQDELIHHTHAKRLSEAYQGDS